jgi:hypothetical protein
MRRRLIFAQALLGQPRPHQGTLIGDREYLIDNAKD